MKKIIKKHISPHPQGDAITYRGNKGSELLIYRDVSFIDNLEIKKLS